MIDDYFTMTELLEKCDVDESLKKDPNFTRLVSAELVRRGYTQKIFKNSVGGKQTSRREWSKSWKGRANMEIPKGGKSGRDELRIQELKKVTDRLGVV